jgi:hypothetical protein
VYTKLIKVSIFKNDYPNIKMVIDSKMSIFAFESLGLKPDLYLVSWRLELEGGYML